MPRAYKLKSLTVDDFKRELRKNRGNVSQTARNLNVTPRALHYWIAQRCTRVVDYECNDGK